MRTSPNCGISDRFRADGTRGSACTCRRSARARFCDCWLWKSCRPLRRPAVLPAATTLVDPPSQEVTAEFLVGESGGVAATKGTAWKVHFVRGVHKGLYITGAWFKRELSEDWIKVLNDARMSELFVPYHQHSRTRFFDLTSFSSPWPK